MSPFQQLILQFLNILFFQLINNLGRLRAMLFMISLFTH